MWLRFFVFSTMIRSTDIRNPTHATIYRRSNDYPGEGLNAADSEGGRL